MLKNKIFINQFTDFLSISKYNNSKAIHQLVKKHIPNISDSDLLNFSNLETLKNNIKSRKTSGNIEKLTNLLEKLENNQISKNDKNSLKAELKKELWKFPNQTHPKVKNYGEEPVELQKFNLLPKFPNNFKPKSFTELGKKLNLFRMEHLGNFTGHKSYYFMNTLAQLEHALIKYTLKNLYRSNFKLISVPDILSPEIIEGCGMQVKGERTQVYKLKSNGKCLSGTSEMALAGYFQNKLLNEDELPIRLNAVSRCYRAETSGLHEEKGIFRVHQFTKVEMFSICSDEQSDEILESFKHIEIQLFKNLGLHFKLLDMPPCELGAPAYRKYDIEAWMPGRNMWGEISSCSNCTDYQAKRLNIKYKTKNGEIKFAHTVNGTACAIPRMLITLFENFQNENGFIEIPKPLQCYMGGKGEIIREKILPELKLVKNIESPSFITSIS